MILQLHLIKIFGLHQWHCGPPQSPPHRKHVSIISVIIADHILVAQTVFTHFISASISTHVCSPLTKVLEHLVFTE